MLKTNIKFDNLVRFHARPAYHIVETAQKYESMIALATPDRIADAKKVFSVMQFALSDSLEMELIVDGPDEHEAMTELNKTIKNIDWR